MNTTRKFRIAKYLLSDNRRVYVPEFKVWAWPFWFAYLHINCFNELITVEFDTEEEATEFIAHKKFTEDKKRRTLIEWIYL